MTKIQMEEIKTILKELLQESTPQEKKNFKKPKMEFSKKWLIGTSIIAVFFTTLSYILSFFDKNPVENLSIELIRILWSVDGASFIGYNVQNCVRAWSLNKALGQDDK